MFQRNAKESTIEDLLDLLAFALGVSSYRAAKGKQADKKLLSSAKTIARQYLPVLEQGLDTFIKPLLERQDAARLTTAWNVAHRVTTPLESITGYGNFAVPLTVWLTAHPTELETVFKQQASAARRLAQAASADAPESVLGKLAANPKVARRARRPYEWTQNVAKEVGVALEGTARAALDVANVAPIVRDRKLVEAKRQLVRVGSEEDAALGQQAARLDAEIDEAIHAAAEPVVVNAAVTTQLAADELTQIQKTYSLDQEQAAVVLGTGRMRVAAVAGAGKTHTVIAKVVHAVTERGIRPERILVTSFTNAAVREIAERLGAQGIENANVGTTHHFAKEVAVSLDGRLSQRFGKGARFGDALFEMAVVQVGLRPRSYRRRQATEQEGWIPKIAKGSSYWKDPIGSWFNLGEVPVDYRGRSIPNKILRTTVGLFFGEMRSPEDAWAEYSDQIETDPLHYFAAAAYGAFKWLCDNDPYYGPAIPLDDWIPTAVRTLRARPDRAKTIQGSYDLVAGDEAQDFNSVQYDFFDLIGAKSETVMLIGDDFQSIYKFRGAKPDLFVSLTERGFKDFRIGTNYRSDPQIVEAGQRLIAHNENRQIQKACRARPGRQNVGAIEAISVADHEGGAIEAASQIAAAVDTSESPGNFGVLVRNNIEQDAYLLALAARGIPFKSNRNPFTGAAIKGMIAWMTLAVGGSDEEVNNAVLQAPNLPKFFLGAAFGKALERTVTAGTYLEYVLSGKPLYDTWQDKYVDSYAKAIRGVQNSADDSETLLRRILKVQGPAKKNDPSGKTFLDTLAANVDPEDLATEPDAEPDAKELSEAALAPLQPLYKMAEQFRDPRKLLDKLHALMRVNDKRRVKEESSDPAVFVGTVHSWKGLQAKSVFICMAGGTFPHYTSMRRFQAGDVTALDEERRLAYVAITRGQENVTILAPAQNYQGKSNPPSPFIEEACVPWQGTIATEPTTGKPKTASSVVIAHDFGAKLCAWLNGNFDEWEDDAFEEEEED